MHITDKRINVALVGYGYAGKTIHAPLIINKAEKLNLVTIVSSDPNKVKRDFSDVSIVANVNDVFCEPDINLVVIATPNSSGNRMLEVDVL